MNKLFFLVIIILSSAILVNAENTRDSDLLLYNGKIFTSVHSSSFVEAVAIKDERIIAIGESATLKKNFRSKQEIDLEGKLVTAGFNDAHIHFSGVGLAMLEVDLNGSKSIDEARKRIAEKIKQMPKGAWITGRGWDHTLWGNRLPTRADLDDISPNNPVFVERVDGHIGWGNSLAFKLAGIDKDTKDPDGGEIVRDRNGEPAGVLKETAQGFVGRVIPQPSKEQIKKGLMLAINEARKFGLTSVQGGADYSVIPVYKQLIEEGDLSVRVAVWQDFESTLSTLIKQRKDFVAQKVDPNRLKLGILKGYMDGSLGSRTAALIDNYSDDPNNKGIPRRDSVETIKMMEDRAAAGFQIGLHAIGDLGVRIALDGFNKVIDKEGKCSSPDEVRAAWRDPNADVISCRYRIEHSQVVEPIDFPRYREMGIIASMQPTHAISDKRWAGDRLGQYRVLGAYAWHTFEAYGVPVAFGTDSPVEPLNPYLTIYAAVTRQSPDGDPMGGWQPQERLTMAEAIRDYTFTSAFAEFSEDQKGTIEVGKLADLVVHTKDLFTIPTNEILTTRPAMTIFNGKIVFKK